MCKCLQNFNILILTGCFSNTKAPFSTHMRTGLTLTFDLNINGIIYSGLSTNQVWSFCCKTFWSYLHKMWETNQPTCAKQHAPPCPKGGGGGGGHNIEITYNSLTTKFYWCMFLYHNSMVLQNVITWRRWFENKCDKWRKLSVSLSLQEHTEHTLHSSMNKAVNTCMQDIWIVIWPKSIVMDRKLQDNQV